MGFAVTLPQLSSCCCGFSLSTGSLITLLLNLIASVINLCSLIFVSNDETYGYVLTLPPTVVIIFGVISIVVTGGGLYAMYSEAPGYMIPFLVWYLVAIIITDVVVIVTTFTITSIIAIVCITWIGCYLWLVVFSYFRVLKGTASPGPA